MKWVEFSGIETPPAGMCLSCWGSAGLIPGSLKKRRGLGRKLQLLCHALWFRETYFRFFRIFFFPMIVQLEFLQGEHVNHYGNFRGGEKNGLGCISLLRWLWNTHEFLFTAVCRPPPALPTKSSQSNPFANPQLPARCFPLEFTKEVNGKMVPPIFLFDVGETS